VDVPSVPFRELEADAPGEGSAAVRARVLKAREIQRERFRGQDGIHANGQMGPSRIRRHCRASPEVARRPQLAVDRPGLSVRVRSFCVTRSDAVAFHHLTRVEITVNDRAFWEKSWTLSVRRDGC
jgi:magnesium chelatase family protein